MDYIFRNIRTIFSHRKPSLRIKNPVHCSFFRKF